MTAGHLWVGVDIGTQSVKASIVDDAGNVHARSSFPLHSDRTSVTHEQNPRSWITGTAAVLSEAVQALSQTDRNRIAALAICATSGTIAVVDSDGTPVSTGFMYDDARAGELADECMAADPARWHRLGYSIQLTWALPKILLLSRTGALPAGTRIAQQADVVAASIVGHSVSSDWSHTLKSGFDLIDEEWPIAVFEKLGVNPGSLPKVVAPGSILGHSSETWFSITGLPAGIPIVAGMTDGCAAQLGAGTLSPGDWHTVIGTTLVVKTVSTALVVDGSGAVYSHRAPEAGLWFPGGASSVGAAAISRHFAGADLDELSKRVAARFASSVESIPSSYPLVGVGERFPIVRSGATGFVQVGDAAMNLSDAGSTLDDETMFASVLLGIASVELLCMETMRDAGVLLTGRVTSSGGGASNAWWTQLRADLLGRPISIPVSAEGSIGMAVLASWSIQSGESLATVAERMSPIGTTIEPQQDRHEQLQAGYSNFKDALRRNGWMKP